MCGIFRCFKKRLFQLVGVSLIRRRSLSWCDRGLFHFIFLMLLDWMTKILLAMIVSIFIFTLSNSFPNMFLTLIFSRRYSKEVLSEGIWLSFSVNISKNLVVVYLITLVSPDRIIVFDLLLTSLWRCLSIRSACLLNHLL